MSCFIRKSNVELEDGTKTTVYYLTEEGKTQFERLLERIKWPIDHVWLLERIKWPIEHVLKIEQRLYILELPTKKAKLYAMMPDEPHTVVWLRNHIPDFHYGVLNELQKDGLVTKGRMIQKVKKP